MTIQEWLDQQNRLEKVIVDYCENKLAADEARAKLRALGTDALSIETVLSVAHTCYLTGKIAGAHRAIDNMTRELQARNSR